MCSEIGHTVQHDILFPNTEMSCKISCNNVFRKDRKRIQNMFISLLVSAVCRIPFSVPPSHSLAILYSVIRHQFFDSSYVGTSVLPTYHYEFTTVTNARH
jgi:predicted nucleic acid-binding Zn ribbon protein